MYNNLMDQGYSQVKLVGIGKTSHINTGGGLNNWTSITDVGVCADESPNHITWNEWNAGLRDVIILNPQREVVYQANLTPGFSSDEIASIIISNIPETATCDEIEEE